MSDQLSLKAVAATTLASKALGAEVLRAFAAEGVASIVLKGPTIARWLYPDELRSYSDIDLLIAPASLKQAEATLRRLDFRPPEVSRLPFQRPRHSLPWRRPNQMRPSIDVHTHLWGALASPQEQWDALAAATEPIDLAGVEGEALSKTAIALHITLHVAHHGPRAVKPLRDLERVLEEEPEAPFWSQVRRLSAALRADEAFSAGLRAHPVGAALADELGLPNAASFAVVVQAERDASSAAGVQQLVETRGWRPRLELIFRTFFPHPAFMRARYPIAARNRGGLIASYLARPLPLLARLLFVGIPTWFRARRAGQNSR